ncbi:non-homologous end joining protein Ku [Aeromicrobium wangtongii]|uniref:Non-homologous end joining protein Ku n=1 Tax=Aeromicrobium wangtongii TaxID=2969247 RepID=A0ABY5M6U2_9ACTN|nr:Ku protein [Aeromicrobium wangtongii]MCD9199522.1 Ku protein [Aeromicrobium wangtongii]UUP13875.1 Ku protein [Aeromicrobium wangtongii]
MRSIWKGAISFGLVSVPVKVYSATESHDVRLHQVHDKDGGRIRYQRRCEICGEVVDYSSIDKAYDNGDQTVVLTEQDLASLPAERNHEIEVVEFVPSDQVDLLRLDRSYYLEPDAKTLKQYTLLRRALEDSDRTAIVRFALRQKTRLAALRVRGNVLLLQTLLWDDEVREPAFDVLKDVPSISQKERDMAAQLVESLAGDFDSAEFSDDYQEQLRTLVEAKLEQGDALDTTATFGEQEKDDDADVVDLMEALKRSIDRKKSGSDKTAPAKTAATKKTTAKKTPAKKTTAKKTTAKKTTAKKAPAKKTPAKKAG